VSDWEKVRFDGNCIKDRTKITKNDEDVTKTLKLIVRGKGSGDCLAVYVRSMDVSPADLL